MFIYFTGMNKEGCSLQYSVGVVVVFKKGEEATLQLYQDYEGRERAAVCYPQGI